MKSSTVLITGTNRGLGLGLVRAYLEDGWKVIAVNRSQSAELDELSSDHLTIMYCDLTDDDELARVADSLGENPLDVLINNAGRMARSGFVASDQSSQGFGHFDRALWHDMFNINLFTPMRLAELLAGNLARAERGRIVTISSMLGSMELNTSGGIYAYRASKAGVNAIIKSMSVDLADRGIIAIAQHPGWVRTDMGGPGADIEIETSVNGMKTVIDGLTPADSGKLLSYDGSVMPW
jgi:NAD(P)-dependent dehydrogenase (short-subunit alcohol dehydrogenase family)